MSTKRVDVPVQFGHRAGGLFSTTLWRMAQNLPPTERLQKQEKKQHASKLRAQAVLTDETLARWRGEYEAGGISMKQMAAKYGTTYSRMYKLLTYQERGDVDPIPFKEAA